MRLKAAVRAMVDKYNLAMIMSPAQSIVFKDVDPKDKDAIDALLASYGVKPVGDYDPISRHSMACPALPLCGLAITEAERAMPDMTRHLHSLLEKHGMGDEQIITRMTGCPNGCARPYMAGAYLRTGWLGFIAYIHHQLINAHTYTHSYMTEIAFVGDGPDSYQIWLGGSPALTRVAYSYQDKVKTGNMDAFFTQLFTSYKADRKEGEAFGDWAWRLGKDGVQAKMAA